MKIANKFVCRAIIIIEVRKYGRIGQDLFMKLFCVVRVKRKTTVLRFRKGGCRRHCVLMILCTKIVAGIASTVEFVGYEGLKDRLQRYRSIQITTSPKVLENNNLKQKKQKSGVVCVSNRKLTEHTRAGSTLKHSGVRARE